MISNQAFSLAICAVVHSSALFFSISAQAGPAETAWMPGALSKARLVAAGGLDAGATPKAYRLGLDIGLTGQAHTYWRMPGDAGVPPTLSFTGSRNLKSAQLAFPAPLRLDEAGLQIFGYTGGVLLPLTVVPENPELPVHVAFTFSYAACEKICIPAEARAALDLSPNDKASPHAGRIAEALSKIPAPTKNGEAVKLAVASQEAGAKPVWSIKVDKPAGPWRDLFAEGPEGWFFETSQTPDGFRLVAADRPKDAKLPVPVTLTLAGAKDFEVRIELAAP